jgi:hypothetical protein
MNVLLIPLAAIAFVIFLLVLGTIGLFVSMAVLGAVGRLWRIVSRADRRGRRRQQA